MDKDSILRLEEHKLDKGFYYCVLCGFKTVYHYDIRKHLIREHNIKGSMWFKNMELLE